MRRASRGRRRVRRARWTDACSTPAGLVLASLVFLGSACRHAQPRPSIVLAVLDTTRADAVSAYGAVEGTTPHVDALARDGLLYEHAYANANWTLPSHASFFTGLLPSENGVRGGNDKIESVPTLAGVLAKAGYETIGFNENPWLTPKNGLSRGFEHWRSGGAGMAKKVRKWLAGRKKNRPFFLFLNIMNAHQPYLIRAGNPYLPASFDRERALTVMQHMNDYICRCAPNDPDIRLLRGLYYDSVRSADEKLGAVLAAVRGADPSVIAVVIADHGEHFGEHGLLQHDIGVDYVLLHVPLVVHGLRGVVPARISAPVELVDLMPTILGWAGAAVPAGLAGQPLPTAEPTPGTGRAIVSEFHDYFPSVVATLPERARRLIEETKGRWSHCEDGDHVSGDMRSLIRYPYKYVWYDKYPPQLFDVQADPGEERDLSGAKPEELAALAAQLQQVLASMARRPSARAVLGASQVERLRALGYLGGEDAAAAKGTPGGPPP